jgi:tRNA (guanine37-N1)-methyltransferase
VVLLTPQGERLEQARVRRWVEVGDVVLVLGRYKGIDERVRSFVTREASIGDYILSGAEPAALVVADAMARLVPGVLGDAGSGQGDSFENSLLDSSYYTRPEEFRGMKVPEVLLSGHHAKIQAARRRDALERTWRRRPDLLEDAELTKEEQSWLRTLGQSGGNRDRGPEDPEAAR